MKRKTMFKFLAAFVALAIPVLAMTVATDTVPITTAQNHAAAGATNLFVGATSIPVDYGDSAAANQGLSLTTKLYSFWKGTNAASTNGYVRQFYAISYDGITFTTDNRDRFVDTYFDGNRTVGNCITVDVRGVKAIADGGYAVVSADNGFTNRVAVIGHNY